MLERRSLLKTIGIGSTTVALDLNSISPSRAETSTAHTLTDQPTQDAIITPTQALKELLAGNQRFVSGDMHHPHQDADRRTDLANHQTPFVTLFGCSDSRLSSEIIFDQGLGDMFVVRTAGHVFESPALGSIEYGVHALNTPLVVVIGHDSCGAVKAAKQALEQGEFPSSYIRDLVEPIIPSLVSPNLPQGASINDIVQEHTRQTCENILKRSQLLTQAVEENRTAVVGMFYGFSDGKAKIVFASDNISQVKL